MSLFSDLTAREQEVIRMLKVLRSFTGKFTVIGGYAVNALASGHRFSVDCDFVISRKSLNEFDNILTNEGYQRDRSDQLDTLTGPDTKRYSKSIGERKVLMDLFIDGILCRQTQGSWKYDLIKEHTIESIIPGVTDSVKSFVPKRELLIAMKTHSGRDADLKDIVMLSQRSDWKLVSQFADVGVKEKVLKQLTMAIEKINTRKFSSDLKSEFGLKTTEERLINQTISGLQSVESFILL